MPASPLARVGAVAGAVAALPFVGAPATAAAAPPTTTSAPEHTTFCSTRALTGAEIDAQVRSTVECYATFSESLEAVGVTPPPGIDARVRDVHALAAQPLADYTGLVAIHYKSAYGSGEALSIAGTDCDGGGVNFSPGDGWNDSIGSTRHRLCSQVKHYSDAGFSGNLQTTNGASGAVANLNGALNDQVSSIRYFGPKN